MSPAGKKGLKRKCPPTKREQKNLVGDSARHQPQASVFKNEQKRTRETVGEWSVYPRKEMEKSSEQMKYSNGQSNTPGEVLKF